jgi:hypothetical protein
VFLFLGAAVNLSAKTWKVYPTMTRAAIQAVINQAKDLDLIRFYAGTYDFSDTPFSSKPFAGGALIVTNKSLSFVADIGTILLGAPSIVDPTLGYGTSGIIAFNVMNSAVKYISFNGFTFQKFLIAIDSGIQTSYDPVTGDVMAPSCRNFTVQNCRFEDIDRNAISAAGVQQNIAILNNVITWSLRMGIFIDWYWVGDRLGTQPKAGKITIESNEVNARILGIYINRPNKQNRALGYNMSIKNNSFDAAGSDTESRGLEIDGGATDAIIQGNSFTNLTQGLDLNGETTDVGGIIYSYPLTKLNITKNTLVVEAGIFLGNAPCYANKITYNTIGLGGAEAWGVTVYESYNDTLTNNIFFGTGQSCFAVQGSAAASSHNEYFKGNSVKNFICSTNCVHYYMSPYSHDNTAIGICSENATYYDEGVNNTFQCLFLPNSLDPLSKNGFKLSMRSPSDRKPLTN